MLTLMLIENLFLVINAIGIRSYSTNKSSECAMQDKHLHLLYFHKSVIVQVNILQVPEFSAQISQFADAVLKFLHQFKVTSTVATTNSFSTAEHIFKQRVTVIKDNASIKANSFSRSYPDRLKKFPVNTNGANIIITWNQTFLVNYLPRNTTFS